MSLSEEFWRALPEKTDEQLYDDLAHPDDYIPEALQAVKEELQKRNLPQERDAELQTATEQKLATQQEKADESLSWILKAIIFLASGTLILVIPGLAILPSYYEGKGYSKKARQCSTWFLWGMGTWLGLGAILGLLMYLAR